MVPRDRVRVIFLVLWTIPLGALEGSGRVAATPAVLECGLQPLHCSDPPKGELVSCGTAHCEDSPTGNPWAECEYCPR
jgi:hypothetical protein